MIQKKDFSPLKYKKQTLSEQIEKSFRALMVTMGILIALLYISYLYIGTNSQEKGYILRELQEKNEKLYYENKILDKKIIEAETLKTIEKSNQTKKMQSPEEITYSKDTDVAIENLKNRY